MSWRRWIPVAYARTVGGVGWNAGASSRIYSGGKPPHSGYLAPWFPAVPIAAMAILGMVSYFAGVVQTPITAFVIVMEITGSQNMALPLMATAFIAYGASRLVCREPIYRALARRFMEPDPTMPLQRQRSE